MNSNTQNSNPDSVKAGEKSPYIVVIPVYNDWEALSLLLESLDKELHQSGNPADILVVDDGSSLPIPSGFCGDYKFNMIRKIDILKLGRNLGHQRAIAIALAYIHEKRQCRAIVVMDGDGEDSPADVPRLIEASRNNESKIIFAERTRRSERWLFKFLYSIFKTCFYWLTGIHITFGNFSIIPCSVLDRLVVVAELWNHYPAGVLKARFPYDTLPTVRNIRLVGKSQMSFVPLIFHGLSALLVYGDTIGIRALIGAFFLIFFSIFMIAVVTAIRIFTNMAIPGWASYLVAAFIIILIQSFILTLFFIFMILHSRNYTHFIPRRDYMLFLSKIENLFEQ
jgi:glycosyltransferase involved in cell wall biosynthesis